MDEHLTEACAMAALAGLCASPKQAKDADPQSGDAGHIDRVTAHAMRLGSALAAKLEAARVAKREEPREDEPIKAAPSPARKR